MVFCVIAAMGELTGYGARRDEALAGARGRLLIVGLGPGYDLAHLPADVSDVLAVEPDLAMRARSVRRVDRAPVHTRLLAAAGEALPLRDDCVDAALVALVLCSVTDPGAAVAELRRVLRPGGTLHVLEHVHASPGTRGRRWQDRLDPLWSRLAAGCSLTRETRDLLQNGGFDTTKLHSTSVRLAPPLVSPHLVGTARATGGDAPSVR